MTQQRTDDSTQSGFIGLTIIRSQLRSLLGLCWSQSLQFWLLAMLWLLVYRTMNLISFGSNPAREDLHLKACFLLGFVFPGSWWVCSWMQLLAAAGQGQSLNIVQALRRGAVRAPLVTFFLTCSLWGAVFVLDHIPGLGNKSACLLFYLVFNLAFLAVPRLAIDTMTVQQFFDCLKDRLVTKPIKVLGEPLIYFMLLVVFNVWLFMLPYSLAWLALVLLAGISVAWCLLAGIGAFLVGLDLTPNGYPSWEPPTDVPKIEISTFLKSLGKSCQISSGLWIRLLALLVVSALSLDVLSRGFGHPRWETDILKSLIWSWATVSWLTATSEAFQGKLLPLSKALLPPARSWLLTGLISWPLWWLETLRQVGSPVGPFGQLGTITLWWICAAFIAAAFLSLTIPQLVLNKVGLEAAAARGMNLASSQLQLVALVLLSGALCFVGLDSACQWLQFNLVQTTATTPAVVGCQLLINLGQALSISLFWPLAFCLHWHLSGANQKA